ncbi:hypothetical protein RJ55_07177 [Drechmeria coniospora]|nr:hypothetical protein RJ55_07177 [Drechmeria coniospora]
MSSQQHARDRTLSSGKKYSILLDDKPKRADGSDDSDGSDDTADVPRPLPRSHTPGHLASRSIQVNEGRRNPSDLSIRQRSQSTSHVPSVTGRAAVAGPQSLKGSQSSVGAVERPHDGQGGGGGEQTIKARVGSTVANSGTLRASRTACQPTGKVSQPPRGPHTALPALASAKDRPDVEPAPASGMYWSRASVSGSAQAKLRAHTATLVGSNVYVFGGCDAQTCFNSLYVLDADAFYWSVPHMMGEMPPPLRAMTCTAVGKKLVVFGGGDGPAYYNDVHVLDTVNFRWTRPQVLGDRLPSKRRAHTACLYKNGIYVFGGGDGVRALNDIWRLDVGDGAKMSWKLISSPARAAAGTDDGRPRARGYHTANMVGGKLIVFGGSDGGECFDDVWVYDVDRHVWKAVDMAVNFRRLSHSATIVGSYLFVIGGHDGVEYCNDVLLLNLVTMTWDRRKVYGRPPSGRGYHGTVLHDSRLLTIGGFDGGEVFGDVMMLELAVHAYYSQISHFTIEM